MFKLISVLLPDESYWYVVFSFCICSMVIGPDSQVIPIEYFSVPISHSSIHAGVGVAVGSAAGGIGWEHQPARLAFRCTQLVTKQIVFSQIPVAIVFYCSFINSFVGSEWWC